MGRSNDFWDSFREVLWIAKSTVTTFWFWAPIFFMAYVIFQMWLMFFVHPFTLAILPIALGIYGIRNEEKRIKARYRLGQAKRMFGTHGIGANPEPMKKSEWEVERTVEQYENLLKTKKKQGKKK